MKRIIILAALLACALAVGVAVATDLPGGGRADAGTSTLRYGWAYRTWVYVEVAPESQEVVCQFKVGTNNYGEAMEVQASAVKPWIVFVDSLLITRAVSTAVDVFVEEMR